MLADNTGLVGAQSQIAIILVVAAVQEVLAPMAAPPSVEPGVMEETALPLTSQGNWSTMEVAAVALFPSMPLRARQTLASVDEAVVATQARRGAQTVPLARRIREAAAAAAPTNRREVAAWAAPASSSSATRCRRDAASLGVHTVTLLAPAGAEKRSSSELTFDFKYPSLFTHFGRSTLAHTSTFVVSFRLNTLQLVFSRRDS